MIPQRQNPKEENMEEILVSSRDLDQRVSPSPSPDKYDIAPRKMEKEFEIAPKRAGKPNYYSVTNKKAKKYDYRTFDVNNSTRQKVKTDVEGKIISNFL